MEIITYILTFCGGCLVGIFTIALLSANKHDDIEAEKLASYKEGYKKGFDDGYELQKSHTK